MALRHGRGPELAQQRADEDRVGPDWIKARRRLSRSTIGVLLFAATAGTTAATAMTATGGPVRRLALAGVSVGYVGMLLQRVMRPTLEARYYAHDIKGATEAVRRNLEALERFARTREATAALRREVERIGAAA